MITPGGSCSYCKAYGATWLSECQNPIHTGEPAMSTPPHGRTPDLRCLVCGEYPQEEETMSLTRDDVLTLCERIYRVHPNEDQMVDWITEFVNIQIDTLTKQLEQANNMNANRSDYHEVKADRDKWVDIAADAQQENYLLTQQLAAAERRRSETVAMCTQLKGELDVARLADIQADRNALQAENRRLNQCVHDDLLSLARMSDQQSALQAKRVDMERERDQWKTNAEFGNNIIAGLKDELAACRAQLNEALKPRRDNVDFGPAGNMLTDNFGNPLP